MKTKAILSIITTGLCLILFSFVTLAWIVINNNTKTDPIGSEIHEKTCEYSLEYYVNNTWNESSSNILLNEFVPNSVHYFRLTITNNMTETITIKTRIREYVSILSNELKYDDALKNIYVTDREGNNLPLYDVDSEKKVIVNNKVLYDCSTNEVKLGEIKIEDSVQLYSLENNEVPSLTGALPVNLDRVFLENTVVESNESVTMYFALEFVSSENDNLYQFQMFEIKGIVISLT